MLQSEHYDYVKQDSYMFLAKLVLSHEKHCLHFDQNRIVKRTVYCRHRWRLRSLHVLLPCRCRTIRVYGGWCYGNACCLVQLKNKNRNYTFWTLPLRQTEQLHVLTKDVLVSMTISIFGPTSQFLGLRAGNPVVTSEFSAQAVSHTTILFSVVNLNMLLDKQYSDQWYKDTQWSCDVIICPFECY